MTLPNISASIGSSKALEAEFAELEDRAKRAVVRAALRKSSAVVLKKFKATAWRAQRGRIPKAAGTSIIVNSGRVEALIGVKKAAAWAWPLEVGSSKMAARPRLRPALDESHQQIRDVFIETIDDQIVKKSAKQKLAAALAAAASGED